MAVLPMALFGAIVGSFVGAAVLRLPVGRGIVAGRSSCDSCGTLLGVSELVPILSYAVQRGRCRHCRTTIAIEQPLAELGCALVGAVVALAVDDLSSMLALAIFGWILVALALLDARHHWLPDGLTLPLIALGLLASLLHPAADPIGRTVGAVIGYALLELLRRLYRRWRGREGLGGGDPKLFAAIGAWLGYAALPWVMLIAGVTGLLFVLLGTMRGHTLSRDDRLPLGTLLAVAAILMIPVSVSQG